jgi:hypothetical protein
MERVLYESLVAPDILLDGIDEASRAKLPRGIIMQVRAKVGHAGRVTANGRLYTKALMKREVEALQEAIANKEVEGLAGHPIKELGGLPNPATASYLLTGLGMDEDTGEVTADFGIYETSAGKDLAARCRAGVKVGFSTRGTGESRKVVLTDKHPAYAENTAWQGKEIEEVEDNYRLRSFDHVIGQAVPDARVRAIREQEEAMDLTKLSQVDWDLITKSEQFKAAVAAALTEAKAKWEAEVKTVLVQEARDYLKSDQFIEDHFEVDPEPAAEAAPAAPAVDEAGKGAGTITCKACGAKIASGSKFCPQCGEDPTVDPEEEQEEQAREDKRDQKIAALEAEIAANKKREEERAEAEAVDKALAEACKGRPPYILEAVAGDAKVAKVASKDAPEYAKGRIAFYEAIATKSGGTLAAGVTKSKPQDDALQESGGGLVDREMVEMAR